MYIVLPAWSCAAAIAAPFTAPSYLGRMCGCPAGAGTFHTRRRSLLSVRLPFRGSISRVTIADVAGHGESVGEVAERLRDPLREHADHWDQSALIRRLNDGFLKGTSA
jgi:hypothetical protein